MYLCLSRKLLAPLLVTFTTSRSTRTTPVSYPVQLFLGFLFFVALWPCVCACASTVVGQIRPFSSVSAIELVSLWKWHTSSAAGKLFRCKHEPFNPRASYFLLLLPSFLGGFLFYFFLLLVVFHPPFSSSSSLMVFPLAPHSRPYNYKHTNTTTFKSTTTSTTPLSEEEPEWPGQENKNTHVILTRRRFLAA